MNVGVVIGLFFGLLITLTIFAEIFIYHWILLRHPPTIRELPLWTQRVVYVIALLTMTQVILLVTAL